ncbi:AMP-binding protein [Niveispirillum sp. KHB5.9]|uniref:AMP-binding protein n=1 Tax=Niveispirillum sp. KHB5.9 TaxID=3400269 RepID=UPI003A889C92
MSALRSPLKMVLDGVAAFPDRDVLTFVDVRPDGTLAEEVRTYAGLLAHGRTLAGALKQAGMQEGDAFALVMRNHPEFVDAMVASEMAGTVFVPIDPRTKGDKLSFMLRFADCRGAIVTPDVVVELRPLLPRLPHLDWVWVLGGEEADGIFHPLSTVLATAEPWANPQPRPLAEPMQMLYTSGTTGDPKAILAPYARFAGVAALGSVIGLTAEDRPYTGLSLTHANAQLITLGNALSMGLRLVISRQFTKSRLWPILHRYGCTMFNLLGGMATAIFAEPPAAHDRGHKVRYVLSAGMPAAMWRAFEARFALRVFEFYGAAEGGLTLNPPGTGPVGSIGKPPPGSVCAILDEGGGELPVEAQGEICFRNADGSVAPVAYFCNRDASEAKTRGGWFHTGDVGFKDAGGWVYFCYRAGDSIRRNGDFINAVEIEAAVAGMAEVADVHVYGVATQGNAPGEKEVVVALVPQPGCEFDPARIFSHCATALGSTSIPSYVQIVGEIPKTASEKPQARHLIALLGAGDAVVFNKEGPCTVAVNGRMSK